MSLFVATASFSSEASMWQLLLLVGISFLVGVLGGFVGLALGTMRLPAMLLLGIPAPLAAGTNIFVSTLSALTGSLRHLRDGRVDFRIVAAMGGPAVVGAFIGGFFSGVAPEELLVGLAGAFVLWQGVELAMLGRRTRSAQRKPPSLENPKIAFTWPRLTTEGGIGFGVGLLGGAVGLILGSIRLPALVNILHIEPRRAAGTNLFIGFCLGAFGFIGHGVKGEVDWPLLIAMGVSGMVGGYYGARLTGRVSMGTLLLVMGAVLVAVGALLVWTSAA